MDSQWTNFFVAPERRAPPKPPKGQPERRQQEPKVLTDCGYFQALDDVWEQVRELDKKLDELALKVERLIAIEEGRAAKESERRGREWAIW